MSDYFFSYKKTQKHGNEDDKKIEELFHDISHMIAMDILNEINLDVKAAMPYKEKEKQIDFKKLLEDEIAKFDSVEEVKYLSEYLIDLWKKTHEV